MIIKFKNKVYDSVDVPFFIFFKEPNGRRDFISFLNNYNNFKEFIKIDCIKSALVGSSVLKDGRSNMYISFECKEEKQFLQKTLFVESEGNALLLSPSDIKMEILEDWVAKNIELVC